jgi:thiosulfate dehydrogenase [quinone] large subunit
MQITGVWHQRGAALLRVTAGVVMLWAGLEKLIGTPGGFDVAGFFKFGTAGSLAWPFVTGEPAKDAVFNPLHGFWVGLADNAAAVQAIDFLVVFGELAIGICLILGLATRFAAICGALMMGLFFLATWNFAYGVVNQQLTYLVVFLAIAGIGAGKYYGLDGFAAETRFARDHPSLRRYILSGDPAPAAGTTPTATQAA